jgi:hypothetical protein
MLCCGLVSSQSDAWKKSHAFEDRYEGLMDHPEAMRDYEILGFFGYDKPFPIPNSGLLHIAYFLPRGDAISFFYAKEIVVDTQYFMEPKLERLAAREDAWNSFAWPVKEVIVPNKVDASKLGVIIGLRDPRFDDLLAPAVYYADGDAAKVTGYDLIFLSNHDLDDVRCIASSNRQAKTYRCGPAFAALNQFTPVRFRIEVPPSLDEIITIQIQGRYAESGGRFQAEFHFIHHRFDE